MTKTCCYARAGEKLADAVTVWLAIFRNAPICVGDDDAGTQGGGFVDGMRAHLSAAMLAH